MSTSSVTPKERVQKNAAIYQLVISLFLLFIFSALIFPQLDMPIEAAAIFFVFGFALSKKIDLLKGSLYWWTLIIAACVSMIAVPLIYQQAEIFLCLIITMLAGQNFIDGMYRLLANKQTDHLD